MLKTWAKLTFRFCFQGRNLEVTFPSPGLLLAVKVAAIDCLISQSSLCVGSFRGIKGTVLPTPTAGSSSYSQLARQDLGALNLEGETLGATKALRNTLSYAKKETESVVPTHEARHGS